MKKFFKGFVYAANGIAEAIKVRGNILVHLCAGIISIFMGFYFNISQIEWVFVTILIVLVIAAEMINTSIEKVVDMISLNKNEQARIIKDISAGSVLVISIGALIIGLIIFIPKIF